MGEGTPTNFCFVALDTLPHVPAEFSGIFVEQGDAVSGGVRPPAQHVIDVFAPAKPKLIWFSAIGMANGGAASGAANWHDCRLYAWSRFYCLNQAQTIPCGSCFAEGNHTPTKFAISCPKGEKY